MRTIERSAKKILIEATKLEIEQKGFDALWDEVRYIYMSDIYDVDSIDESEDGKILFIRLVLKKK